MTVVPRKLPVTFRCIEWPKCVGSTHSLTVRPDIRGHRCTNGRKVTCSRLTDFVTSTTASAELYSTVIGRLTAAQFAVDCEVKQGKIADSMSVLKVDSDGPNVFGPERWLLADQLAFVARLTGLFGLHGTLPQERREFHFGTMLR